MLTFTPGPDEGFDSGLLTAEQFRDVIDMLEVPWRVGIESDNFTAHVRHRKFGDCIFGEMAFGYCSGERNTPEIDRGLSDYICISHQLNGRLNFSRGERTTMVERGDLLLWDGMTPCSFTAEGPGRFELIWLPAALVERRIGSIESALVGKASAPGGSVRMLSNHLRNLHHSIGELPNAIRHRVIDASIDLIFACFSTDLHGRGDLTRQQKELLDAARQEISTQLGPDKLTPAFVAKKLGVSVRHLQKLFAMSGQTFSGYVSSQRLEMARKMLLIQSPSSRTITEIAHQAGFCDHSHLNRAFKRHFGMSPARFRALH